MLNSLGVGSLEDLFSQIPSSLRLERELNISPGQSESELISQMEHLSEENLNHEK